MREHLAHLVLLLTLVVAVGLSFVFAVRHNPAQPVPYREPGAAKVPAPPVTDQAATAVGRGTALFTQHNCTACHAIAGNGNPRYPLDDTGDHWTNEELHHWIVGTGEVTSWLSDAVRRRKARYQSLPEEDLRDLVHYLSTLRATAD